MKVSTKFEIDTTFRCLA